MAKVKFFVFRPEANAEMTLAEAQFPAWLFDLERRFIALLRADAQTGAARQLVWLWRNGEGDSAEACLRHMHAIARGERARVRTTLDRAARAVETIRRVARQPCAAFNEASDTALAIIYLLSRLEEDILQALENRRTLAIAADLPDSLELVAAGGASGLPDYFQYLPPVEGGAKEVAA